MAPHPEPHKPIYTPCRHECKGGCSIYDLRPKACRDFMCLWLATQQFGSNRMPKNLRPDRVGVVLEVNSHNTDIAHCRTGEEWRKEPIISELRHYLLKDLTVLVGHHESYNLLRIDGTTEELVKVGEDPLTHEVQYARKAELIAKGIIDATA